jgi:hypothetical protein
MCRLKKIEGVWQRPIDHPEDHAPVAIAQLRDPYLYPKMPLTLFVHPPSRNWNEASYTRCASSSDNRVLLADMKKRGSFPKKGFNCYLTRTGRWPSWLDSANSKGGQFSPDKPFNNVDIETLQYLRFMINEQIAIPGEDGDRELVDLRKLFSVIGFTVGYGQNGSVACTPKIWLCDSRHYQLALRVLRVQFPHSKFSFDPFVPENMPKVADIEVRQRTNARSTPAEEFMRDLNNITEQNYNLTYTLIIRKLTNDAEFVAILVSHIWAHYDNRLLFKLATDIDRTRKGFLKTMLDRMESTVVKHNDPDTQRTFQTNIDVASAQLRLQLLKSRVRDFDTSQLVVDETSFMQFVEHNIETGKLDVLVELLKQLLQDDNYTTLAERIRSSIEVITKKTGKQYYVMLDIYDEMKRLRPAKREDSSSSQSVQSTTRATAIAPPPKLRQARQTTASSSNNSPTSSGSSSSSSSSD